MEETALSVSLSYFLSCLSVSLAPSPPCFSLLFLSIQPASRSTCTQTYLVESAILGGRVCVRVLTCDHASRMCGNTHTRIGVANAILYGSGAYWPRTYTMRCRIVGGRTIA